MQRGTELVDSSGHVKRLVIWGACFPLKVRVVGVYVSISVSSFFSIHWGSSLPFAFMICGWLSCCIFYFYCLVAALQILT